MKTVFSKQCFQNGVLRKIMSWQILFKALYLVERLVACQCHSFEKCVMTATRHFNVDYQELVTLYNQREFFKHYEKYRATMPCEWEKELELHMSCTKEK